MDNRMNSGLSAWAEEMPDLFRSGAVFRFLLYGNIFNLVVASGSPALRLFSLNAFLGQVMDFSFIRKLQRKGTFAHHRDESITAFTPSSFRKVPAESPILTQTIRINFYPNSSNPYEPGRDEFGNVIAWKLYDPNGMPHSNRWRDSQGNLPAP